MSGVDTFDEIPVHISWCLLVQSFLFYRICQSADGPTDTWRNFFGLQLIWRPVQPAHCPRSNLTAGGWMDGEKRLGPFIDGT